MTKEVTPEAPQVKLDELQTILSIIGVPGQSDRGFLASLPREKLAEVSLFAENVVYECLRDDHRLQIKVGRKAIDGYQPGTAVDIQREHHFKLKPGSTLLVDKYVRIFDEVAGDLNHFFSGSKTFISLGSAAANLLQGGAISVVESNKPAERIEFKK